jgi:hypothetical protein
MFSGLIDKRNVGQYLLINNKYWPINKNSNKLYPAVLPPGQFFKAVTAAGPRSIAMPASSSLLAGYPSGSTMPLTHIG